MAKILFINSSPNKEGWIYVKFLDTFFGKMYFDRI